MARSPDQTDEELLEWLNAKFMQWVVSTGGEAASAPLAPLGKALKYAQEFFEDTRRTELRIARADEPIVIEFDQASRLWRHPSYLKHPSFKDW